MNGKRMFRLWMLVVAISAVWTAAEAAPPWTGLISLKNVSADPGQTYPLSEENGPWMIMACSFSGKGAEEQAQELVHEFRKRYKLPAYMYKARFDLGEAPGRGVDQFGKPIKWQYSKFKGKARAEVAEVAVLVGNYPTADHVEIQETLHKIKYATPQCLELKEGKTTHQTLTGWRMIQKQVYEAIGSEKKKLGPMSHAFVTTNPLLPSDFFAPKGIDEAIVALNQGVPHSLLDCPGKFTVQVATFKGNVVIKQDEIKAIENGKEMRSELAVAAQKADALCKALRLKGYEAYQFHDRFASIVTVGSFNSVGTPRPDGRTEIDPDVHRIMKTFGAEQTTLPGQASPVTPLKTLIGIPFDIQPIPVQVPKRPASFAFRREE